MFLQLWHYLHGSVPRLVSHRHIPHIQLPKPDCPSCPFLMSLRSSAQKHCPSQNNHLEAIFLFSFRIFGIWDEQTMSILRLLWSKYHCLPGLPPFTPQPLPTIFADPGEFHGWSPILVSNLKLAASALRGLLKKCGSKFKVAMAQLCKGSYPL